MVQISDEWLLSAAQCVDGKHAAAIQVESSLALYSSSLLSQSLLFLYLQSLISGLALLINQ